MQPTDKALAGRLSPLCQKQRTVPDSRSPRLIGYHEGAGNLHSLLPGKYSYHSYVFDCIFCFSHHILVSDNNPWRGLSKTTMCLLSRSWFRHHHRVDCENHLVWTLREDKICFPKIMASNNIFCPGQNHEIGFNF